MPRSVTIAPALLSLAVTLAIVLMPAAFCHGDEQRTQDVEFFETRIRPVLAKHCFECHSAEAKNPEGGLSLDHRKAALRGGERGPAIVMGDPASSWLLTAITHADPDLRMPPRRPKLSNQIIADFRHWIEIGAPGLADAPPEPSIQPEDSPPAARKLWSLRPLQSTSPPDVSDRSWPRTAVDDWVLSRLDQQHLQPSPDAAPSVLLRRVYFDLTGLPPAPEELDQFCRAVTEQGMDTALADVVDRLLTSPQYGERWGRHWLDVARFGESSGGEANISFPYAWRYRDYVIDCFQQDVPFDRFIGEQLAGDLLPAADAVERARLLTATGFLAVGTRNLDAADQKQFIADLRDEQIDTVTRALMGSSVACARCHDHKFDPWTMNDYYSMAGIFASTRTFFGTAVSPANRIGGDPLVLPRVDGQQIFHRSIPPQQVQKFQDQLAALKKEQKDRMAQVFQAVAEGRDPSGIFPLRDALRIFWQSGRIEGELEKVDQQGQALPLTMGVLEEATAVDAPLLSRGDVSLPQETVGRGFPAAIELSAAFTIPADRSGRLELAEWLTHPDHPLTSRVAVNRIWHHLFGSGLVSSVDHFGSMGERPSHPELLDYLAIRFSAVGWSWKQLIRELVLSRTYRQSSEYRPDAFLQDPENRWLWRMPKRRLEAEAIRDAMLAVAGQLDLQRPSGSLVAKVIGDRPIALIGLDPKIPKDLDDSTTRSVYLPVIRDRLPEVLDLFDFAEPGLVTGQRDITNVPIQALYLMNSPFVRARSEGLAERLTISTMNRDDQIRQAFLLCFARQPDPQELQSCMAAMTETLVASDAQAAEHSMEPLIQFCQALLCTAEFRNLD